MHFTLRLLILCTALLTPGAIAACGDVNSDGQIDIIDTLVIARHSVGLSILEGDALLDADVTGDAQVTTLDMLWTAQYVAAVPVTFACLPPPTPVAKLYVATYFPNELVIVDAAAGSVLDAIPLATEPWSLAVHPVYDLLYISDGTETVTIVDTALDSIGSTFDVPGLAAGIAVTPDGAALVGFSLTGLVVVDLPAQTVRHHIPTGSIPFGAGYLTMSPDSQFAWTTDLNAGTAIKADLALGVVAATVSVGAAPMGLDLSIDGSTLYVVNNGEQTLSRVDTATNLEVMPRRPLGNYPLTVIGHSSGSAYAASCASNFITEHEGASCEQTDLFSGFDEPMEICEVDGELGVMSATSSTVSLLDPVTGSQRNLAFTGSPLDVASK